MGSTYRENVSIILIFEIFHTVTFEQYSGPKRGSTFKYNIETDKKNIFFSRTEILQFVILLHKHPKIVYIAGSTNP